MQARFWYNHTIHNTFPNRVEQKMKNKFNTHEADAICLVNDQNFKSFLLNLEACAAVCKDEESFDGPNFYKDWSHCYFQGYTPIHAMPFLKLPSILQQCSEMYVKLLWEISGFISYLSDKPIEHSGKSPVTSNCERAQNDFEPVARITTYIEKLLQEEKKGLHWDASMFYYFYFYLLLNLYQELIYFEQTLHTMTQINRKAEVNNDPYFIEKKLELIPIALEQLETLYKNKELGNEKPKMERLVRSKNTKAQQRFSQ